MWVVHFVHPESESDWIEGPFSTKEEAEKCVEDAPNDGCLWIDIQEVGSDQD